jgi:uncharacterized membrane protein YheB (UPF0754 family)
MLFRPLKEVRVFGIRLPFTPGILPRQRHRLAQSIGAMVERELLTPEILRQRLARDDVREKIRSSLAEFTQKIISGAPETLLAGHEAFLTKKISSITEKMYPAAAAGVLNFLNSAAIRRELEAKGRFFFGSVMLKLNVFQRIVLSAGQYDIAIEQKMPEIIDELIDSAGNLLRDTGVRKKLTDAAAGAIGHALFEGNPGALFDINEDDKKKLDDYLFEKLMAGADRQIESLLTTINIKDLVAQRIDSLEMLRVERIILDVMADQFKWIDVFGAILGFLIGLFQAAFSWFMR